MTAMSPAHGKIPHGMLCPNCECKDFYREKRFPRKLGLTIIAIAILLSFWTYNISLIVAAIIDALIYSFIPTEIVCYRCKTRLKPEPIPATVQSYDHHLAELYNYGKA